MADQEQQDAISDPRLCCIFGVCCPPGGEEQLATLAEEIANAMGHGHMAGIYAPAAKRVLEIYGTGPIAGPQNATLEEA